MLVASASVRHRVDDVGFDRFDFGLHAIQRHDGAVVQLGAGPDGRSLAVASIAWPDMPLSWMALSSRRSDRHLDLDDTASTPVGNDAVNDRFVIDVDDDDVDAARRLLDAAACRWLVATDDGFGPVEIILDGPDDQPGDRPVTGQPGGNEPAIYVAREVIDADEMLATLDLAAEALTQFDRRF